MLGKQAGAPGTVGAILGGASSGYDRMRKLPWSRGEADSRGRKARLRRSTIRDLKNEPAIQKGIDRFFNTMPRD